MRSPALLLLLVLPALLAGCNATAGTRADGSGATAEANNNRILALEARIIGLTEELDRLGRRLANFERGTDRPAITQGPAAPPTGIPDLPEREALPEIREESPIVPDENRTTEPVLDEPAAPHEAPAEPEPEAPDPIDNPPAPVSSGPWTAILIDAREIPEGALPGTSQAKWRIVDPEGVSIISSQDVDPQVLRSSPLFWTARPGFTLSPTALPVIGERPFVVEAVDGALLTRDPTAEAVIYVGAEGAAKLRGTTVLGTLVRTGRLAIVLRPD